MSRFSQAQRMRRFWEKLVLFEEPSYQLWQKCVTGHLLPMAADTALCAAFHLRPTVLASFREDALRYYYTGSVESPDDVMSDEDRETIARAIGAWEPTGYHRQIQEQWFSERMPIFLRLVAIEGPAAEWRAALLLQAAERAEAGYPAVYNPDDGTWDVPRAAQIKGSIARPPAAPRAAALRKLATAAAEELAALRALSESDEIAGGYPIETGSFLADYMD